MTELSELLEAAQGAFLPNPDELAFFVGGGVAPQGLTVHGEAVKKFYQQAFLARLAEFSTVAESMRQLGEENSHVAVEKGLTVRDEKTKLMELEEQCSQLRLENQLLQSRVAEARRTAARETQRYDQLLAELDRLRVQKDSVLDSLKGRNEANDTTLALLLDQKHGHLKMIESYEGVVERVHGDIATVVFDTDDDVFEHTYKRSQFTDGKLPNEGDRLAVYVHVVHGSVGGRDDAELMEELDDEPCERKKVTGPIEF